MEQQIGQLELPDVCVKEKEGSLESRRSELPQSPSSMSTHTKNTINGNSVDSSNEIMLSSMEPTPISNARQSSKVVILSHDSTPGATDPNSQVASSKYIGNRYRKVSRPSPRHCPYHLCNFQHMRKFQWQKHLRESHWNGVPGETLDQLWDICLPELQDQRRIITQEKNQLNASNPLALMGLERDVIVSTDISRASNLDVTSTRAACPEDFASGHEGACNIIKTDENGRMTSTKFVQDSAKIRKGKASEAAVSTICDTATPGNDYLRGSDSEIVEKSSIEANTVCESDSESSTPSITEQQCIISPVLDPIKKELVDRVMIEFWSLLGQNWGLRSRGNSTKSSYFQQKTRSTANSPSRGPDKRDRKRRIEDRDDSDAPEDGDDDHPKDPVNILRKQDSVSSIKFACPFFKRNMRKHRKYRSCAGPGWDTVHRVKEHIYRRHPLPIQCARCLHSFENELELKQHHRELKICEIRNEQPNEGINKEQEKLLKSRKRIVQGEEEKWKGVYRILFPDEDEALMPSPYYEDKELSDNASWERHRLNEFARYEAFLSRELPRRVRQELEIAVSGLSESLEDQLKSQLMEIVRNCQAQLFKSYQESCHGTNSHGEVSKIPGVLEDGGYSIKEDLAAFFPPPIILEDEINFIPTSMLLNNPPAPSKSCNVGSDSGYNSNNAKQGLDQVSLSTHSEVQDSLHRNDDTYRAVGLEETSALYTSADFSDPYFWGGIEMSIPVEESWNLIDENEAELQKILDQLASERIPDDS